jgi:hypothetical protein
MPVPNKCAACGFEVSPGLSSVAATNCPQCGTKLAPEANFKGWPMALLQIALTTSFMLVFHFPRIMIAIFAVVILASARAQSRGMLMASTKPRIPAASSSQPVTVRILSLLIGICGFLFIATFMLGFVVFMNSWSRWQLYQGMAYHASSFQVVRVYYQQHSGSRPSTGADVFASGMVEGRKEWMDLLQYLKTVPHDQAELNGRVPPGTVIPVYVFPALKGQARIQMIGAVSPAEANHKQAIGALNYGLPTLAVIGGVMFLLIRIRRSSLAIRDVENPLACLTAQS